jgi:hypothetical protein
MSSESQVSELTYSFLTRYDETGEEMQIAINNNEYQTIEIHPNDQTSLLQSLNSFFLPSEEIEIDSKDNDDLVHEFHVFFPFYQANLTNFADFCRFKFHPTRVSYSFIILIFILFICIA